MAYGYMGLLQCRQVSLSLGGGDRSKTLGADRIDCAVLIAAMGEGLMGCCIHSGASYSRTGAETELN